MYAWPFCYHEAWKGSTSSPADFILCQGMRYAFFCHFLFLRGTLLKYLNSIFLNSNSIPKLNLF